MYLRKDAIKVRWTEECQWVFDELTRTLQTPPALSPFDQRAQTENHTDASNKGIGAVVVQIQERTEGEIAYATLLNAEGNYSTTKKECLAVVWTIN